MRTSNDFVFTGCGANEKFSSYGCIMKCDEEGMRLDYGCGGGCFCQNDYVKDSKTDECIPMKECQSRFGTCAWGEGVRKHGEKWQQGEMACKCEAGNIDCTFSA